MCTDFHKFKETGAIDKADSHDRFDKDEKDGGIDRVELVLRSDYDGDLLQ